MALWPYLPRACWLPITTVATFRIGVVYPANEVLRIPQMEDGRQILFGQYLPEIFEGLSHMREEFKSAAEALFGAGRSPVLFFSAIAVVMFAAGAPAHAQDKAQIAQMCQAKANQYTAYSQAGAQMAAACIYWCAYNATGEGQYQQLYQQAQDNANGLCSMGQGNCNEINKQACQ